MPIVLRDAGRSHRTAITSADKLTMGAITPTDSATDTMGALTNVSHNITVAARNAHGVTTAVTVGTVTPTANKAIYLAFAQVSGAVDYQIFLSIGTVAANPLWCGYVTEAQRAAGGFKIAAIGAATAGGSAPAGAVAVAIVGTGVASNANPYAYNTAYCPEDDGPNGTITAIDCGRAATAIISVTLTVNHLGGLPTLRLIPATLDQISNLYVMGDSFQVPIGANLGQGLKQSYELPLKGGKLKLLVDEITAPGVGSQTASLALDVDLVYV